MRIAKDTPRPSNQVLVHGDRLTHFIEGGTLVRVAGLGQLALQLNGQLVIRSEGAACCWQRLMGQSLRFCPAFAPNQRNSETRRREQRSLVIEATLDNFRESVETLEDTQRIARRVLGGAHPITEGIEDELHDARAALYARGLP